MNAKQLVVFDTKKRAVVANLDGFPSVHGVIAVPDLAQAVTMLVEQPHRPWLVPGAGTL